MTPPTKEATPEMAERESVKRREFLKVLGVSTAAGAAIGCGTGDVEKLIPYLVSPDNTVPGVSNHYATTCRECAAGCGLIVEVRDGRAIKTEGNPAHPVNRGALCARGQAGLQGLYNPDRFRGPMKKEGDALVPTTWTDAIGILSQKLGELKSRGQGSRIAFINQHEQGSFPALLDQILAGYGAPAHLSYDAEAPVATAQANRAVYGSSWPRSTSAPPRSSSRSRRTSSMVGACRFRSSFRLPKRAAKSKAPRASSTLARVARSPG
jgi:NADH dehydrogenase/NADH:ubiquinone oxidoreductase subunit G